MEAKLGVILGDSAIDLLGWGGSIPVVGSVYDHDEVPVYSPFSPASIV
jgi:hypothetical protein